MGGVKYTGAVPIFLVVASLATLAPFSIDTYLPSFPDIATDLSASEAQMQWSLSFYLMATAISTLIFGPLSDGFGRRRVIMSALLIYGIASLGCAMASTIDHLLLFRVGQGLSASAGMVIGRAMVRDVYAGANAQKVMARVMLLFGVAPAIAPIIGGFLHDLWGWQSVFLFLASVAALLFLMLWLGTSETLLAEQRQSVHPKYIFQTYLRAFKHRRYLSLILCFALMFSGFFIYIAGAPTIIYRVLALGAHDFWIIFVPFVSAIMVGAMVASHLAGRMESARIVGWGFVLMVCASLFNVAQSVWVSTATPLSVVSPLVIYMLGMSIAMPSLSVMALDCFPHHRGLASAMQSFAQMSLAGGVVALVVPLVVHGLVDMAMTMLALSCVSALFWLLRSSSDLPISH
ncbi:MAG: multidrug effflux MFS transporter [Zetaproteobacteria bacterium]|nr:multidrug effflux MFS transporter [Zetaproteobacteria bacterium]